MWRICPGAAKYRYGGEGEGGVLYTCIYCYFNVGIGGLKGGGSYKIGTREGGRGGIKKCSRHISNISSFNNAAKKSPPPYVILWLPWFICAYISYILVLP